MLIYLCSVHTSCLNTRDICCHMAMPGYQSSPLAHLLFPVKIKGSFARCRDAWPTPWEEIFSLPNMHSSTMWSPHSPPWKHYTPMSRSSPRVLHIDNHRLSVTITLYLLWSFCKSENLDLISGAFDCNDEDTQRRGWGLTHSGSRRCNYCIFRPTLLLSSLFRNALIEKPIC